MEAGRLFPKTAYERFVEKPQPIRPVPFRKRFFPGWSCRFFLKIPCWKLLKKPPVQSPCSFVKTALPWYCRSFDRPVPARHFQIENFGKSPALLFFQKDAALCRATLFKKQTRASRRCHFQKTPLDESLFCRAKKRFLCSVEQVSAGRASLSAHFALQ